MTTYAYNQIGTLLHSYESIEVYSNTTANDRKITFQWTTGTDPDLITATQTLIANLNSIYAGAGMTQLSIDGQGWTLQKKCNSGTLCSDGYLKLMGATALFGTTPIAPSVIRPTPVYGSDETQDDSNWPPPGQGEIVNIPGLGNVKITTQSNTEAVFSLEVEETVEETPVETPVQTPTPTVTPTATDCSAIPQDCRITIPELDETIDLEDDDLFITSKDNDSFKISLSDLMDVITNHPKFINKVISETPNFGIQEAPLDGKQYARQDGQWTEVSVEPAAQRYQIVNVSPTVQNRTRQSGVNRCYSLTQAVYNVIDYEDGGKVVFTSGGETWSMGCWRTTLSSSRISKSMNAATSQALAAATQWIEDNS